MVQYSMSAYNRNSTARHAAEILISGSTEQIKGVKSTIQPFSSVRRMFCLFVTFDMLFMGILWILYLNTSGIGDLKKAFDCQVNHFTIKTSMFDVVLLTAGRVICLLLAYALIRSNHWFTVAFTTSVTCIFLVMKIVYYFGSISSLSTMLPFQLKTAFNPKNRGAASTKRPTKETSAHRRFSNTQ